MVNHTIIGLGMILLSCQYLFHIETINPQLWMTLWALDCTGLYSIQQCVFDRILYI
jgi:hypothetical protein